MNWIVDIVLAAIMIITIIIHTRKGIISLFGFLTPIAAFVAAYFFGPTVGAMIPESVFNLKEISAEIPFAGEALTAAVGCVLTFVAVFILMIILKHVLKGIFKLPVLKQANNLLGFVLGVIYAFAITWVLCIALSVFVEYSLLGAEKSATVASLAENSYIFRFFCDLSLMDFINILPL